MRRAWAVLFLCACGTPHTSAVQPQLIPPKSAYDFGAVPVLNVKNLDIPLQNVGRAALTVTSAALTSDGGTAFSVTAFPGSVESGGTHPVTVAFQPPAEQSYQDTLIIHTDDPTTPVVTVALTGKGSTHATMAVVPASLSFGRVPEGTAAIRSFAVESSGTADLLLNAIGFAAGSSSDFSFLGSVATPATVPVGNQIQITVEYAVPAGATTGVDGGVHLNGTDPARPDVTVPLWGDLNRAPVPVIAPVGPSYPGKVVALDGTGSHDPDNDTPLTYAWTLVNQPLGSSTQIANPSQAVTSMTLDPTIPGEYDVTLDVTDSAGAKDLAPAKLAIISAPAQQLLVEMFQDNAATDLDLHFLRTTTSPFGAAPDDCFYQNPNPAWGGADAGQDPQLLRDVLTGYGPEVMGYDNPISSTFRVVVYFNNAHLQPNPATGATIRVYEFGVEVAQAQHTLQKQGDNWVAADIQWPGGKVTPYP